MTSQFDMSKQMNQVSPIINEVDLGSASANGPQSIDLGSYNDA